MHICVAVVNMVKVTIRRVIEVVREVVRTVCSWVTTAIRTVKEVVKKVCKWLPWPLNKLCDLVTKLVEVIEYVTEWVCKEVIERIIDYVEIIFEYIFYIIDWICWLVDWIVRFFLELIWCWMGIRPKKYIRLCVKILTDNKDVPAMTEAEVRTLLKEAQARFHQCNLELIVTGFEFVRQEKYLTGVPCGFGALFKESHLWFTENSCAQPFGSFLVPITAYVVKDVGGGKGCAIPGTNYIIIDKDASNATIPHEIGHLADLWAHDDDPENVMHAPTSDDSKKFTKHQCCVIRSSKYASLTGKIGYKRLPLSRRFFRLKESDSC